MPHQIEIASASWRRVYTTNYDLVMERATEQAGRRMEVVDIDQPPNRLLSKGNLCVHLNGSLETLSEETLNTTFKLSNSSYVAPHSFTDSPWLYPFRKDLDRASAIVFVGYSLYDIEIQKVLFENHELREKTYFVASKCLDEKTMFTMSKYGQVLPVGAEAFGSDLKSNLKRIEREFGPITTSAFEHYEIIESDDEIRDALIEKFLIHGDLADRFVDNAVRGIQEAPFLVVRSQVALVKTNVNRGIHTVIASDFGNGKSVLMRCIRSQLAAGGIEVYELVDLDGDYIADVETLAKTEGQKVLLVDNYDRCLDLIEYIGRFAPNGITLVLAARASNHERAKTKLQSYGFEYAEVGSDVLSKDEAEFLVDIFDNVGFWADRAGLNHEQKVALVMEDGRAQLSSVLLEIFETPQMKERVAKLIEPLIVTDDWKATVFAISLLESVGLPLDPSLIARVARNDAIYSSLLRSSQAFRDLYNFDSGVIKSKSSLFGLAVIRNNFSATYIIDRLLNFMASLGGGERGEPIQIKELFRQMMRFAQVERLLPQRNRKDNLVRYYETIKRDIQWQSREPHYWVQYAMALLTYSEFDRAQKLLETAYAIAAKRDGYHTHNIDTQQARLSFLRGLATNDVAESARQFNEGHKTLGRVPDDAGKFRQLEHYAETYKARYFNWSSANKAEFEHACKAMLISVERAIRMGGMTPRTEALATRVAASLCDVIADIKGRRENNKR